MPMIVAKDLVRRDREELADTLSGYSVYRYLYSDSSTTKIGEGSRLSTAYRHHTIGWDIPNFHRRRRLGELLPHTSFSHYKVTGSTTAWYDFVYGVPAHDRVYVVGNASEYQSWPVTTDIINSYIPEGYNKYVQEAAAAIYSSGYDLLTFVAELADVRSMFLKAGTALLKLDFPRNWRRLTNAYLSARYGWRTLFFDLEGLNKAIKNLNSGKGKKSRFNKSRSNKTTTINTTDWTSDNGSYRRSHVIVERVSISVKGSVTADIEIPEFQINPFVTAWEVVPLSFVLDWFLSVGKSIAAASFLACNSSYAASTGYRIEVDRSYSETTTWTSSTTFGSRGQDSTSNGYGEFRKPCSVPLTPHFTFRMNPWKVLDLLGLILQRTK